MKSSRILQDIFICFHIFEILNIPIHGCIRKAIKQKYQYYCMLCSWQLRFSICTHCIIPSQALILAVKHVNSCKVAYVSREDPNLVAWGQELRRLEHHPWQPNFLICWCQKMLQNWDQLTEVNTFWREGSGIEIQRELSIAWTLRVSLISQIWVKSACSRLYSRWNRKDPCTLLQWNK